MQLPLLKYHPVNKIGSGTFGTVYEVVEEESGESFACKEFQRDDDNSYSLSTDSMLEISLLRMSANCRQIVKIIDVFYKDFSEEEDSNRPICAVLPKYSISLSSLIKDQIKIYSTQAEKIGFIKGILRGIEFCHNTLHIIHRDIKSENILIDFNRPEEPVLIDFSLASIHKTSSSSIPLENLSDRAKRRRHRGKLDAFSSHLIKMTQGVGTPTYIAPEVYEGKEYDYSADMYSVGVTFLEFFQFELINYDRDKAAFKYIKEDIVDLKLKSSEKVSRKPIISLMIRLLEFNPLHRFTSIEALNHVLSISTGPRKRKLSSVNESSVNHSEEPSRESICLLREFELNDYLNNDLFYSVKLVNNVYHIYTKHWTFNIYKMLGKYMSITNEMTIIAALIYLYEVFFKNHKKFFKKFSDIKEFNINNLVYSLVLSHKFYESDFYEIGDISEDFFQDKKSMDYIQLLTRMNNEDSLDFDLNEYVEFEEKVFHELNYQLLIKC